LRDEQLEELVDERVVAFAAELVEKVWEVVVYVGNLNLNF